jgi:hypothetical protein
MRDPAVAMRSAMLAMLLLATAASVATAEDRPTATTPAAPDAAQWAEFQSPERGFAVSFPGQPKVTTAPVEGQNPLLQYDFQVSVGADTVYSVVVFEYPDGKAPSRLDNDYYVRLVNAYAKGSESRLRKRGPVTLAGRSGFEAIADDGKGKLNHLVDIVPAENRVYMLATAGPRNHATGDDAERFRDSFRLLGNEAQPQSQSAATAPAPAQ